MGSSVCNNLKFIQLYILVFFYSLIYYLRKVETANHNLHEGEVIVLGKFEYFKNKHSVFFSVTEIILKSTVSYTQPSPKVSE